MWLEVGNLRTKLMRATNDERSWLAEYLSFPDEKAKYRQGKYGGMRADGVVRMFNVLSDTFPSGFVPLVRKGAPEQGMTVEVFDRRTRPCEPDPAADLAWLRDYQRAAVLAITQRTRGILWVPTGGGKTEIAIGLSRVLPCRWLFLVHRATLLEQTAARYEQRTHQLAGRVGDGAFDVPDEATFVAATFQTVGERYLKGDPQVVALLTEWAQGIVVDECHVLPANTFWNIAMQTESAYWRVGMSGTPLARGDRRSLLAIAALGPIAYRIKPEVLIEAGVLAKPRIRLVEVAQRSEKPTWQGVYGENIVRGAERNRAVVECVRRAEKPCLLFVKEIKHGKALEKALLRAGITCAFTWGAHSTDHRKSQVRTLLRGAVDCLICSVIFQEGVDIPELRSVVIASGGKSVIAALQRIGRGMRVAKGKDEFEVWDVADKGCGCTRTRAPDGTKHTHSGCRWLEKHTRARLSAYAGEGYQTTIVAIALGLQPAEQSA